MENSYGEDLLKKMKSISESVSAEFEEYRRRGQLMRMVCSDPEYIEAKQHHDEYCAFLKEQKQKADNEFHLKSEEITKRIAKEIWPEKEGSAE